MIDEEGIGRGSQFCQTTVNELLNIRNAIYRDVTVGTYSRNSEGAGFYPEREIAMASARATILLVTADQLFGLSMKTHLVANGYTVDVVRNFQHALQASRAVVPSLLVLDRRVASMKQVRDVCRQVPCLSVQPPGLPCIEEDCLQDLESGADWSICGETYRQITARIRAIVRREHLERSVKSRCDVGGIAMDFERYEVTVDGRPVELTRKQYDILALLLLQPSRVFRKEEILTKIWGEDVALDDHAVDVHIHALRRKIERDPAHPRFLQTIRGVGYKFKSA